MKDYIKFHGQTAVFLEEIRKGEQFGYPRCCAIAYASDIINGKQPEKLRGYYPIGHIPCEECLDVLYDVEDFYRFGPDDRFADA